MKADEVKLHLAVNVYVTDHKNKKLKRQFFERQTEKMLCEVFRLYVENFGTKYFRIVIHNDSVNLEAV